MYKRRQMAMQYCSIVHDFSSLQEKTVPPQVACSKAMTINRIIETYLTITLANILKKKKYYALKYIYIAGNSSDRI